MIPRLLVIDAECVVDLLLNNERSLSVLEATQGATLAAPAHIDHEVMAALAWVEGATSSAMDERIGLLAEMPLRRCPVTPLIAAAWSRHDTLPVSSGLYVALAEQLDTPLITADPVTAAAYSRAVLVERSPGPYGGVTPWSSDQDLRE